MLEAWAEGSVRVGGLTVPNICFYAGGADVGEAQAEEGDAEAAGDADDRVVECAVGCCQRVSREYVGRAWRTLALSSPINSPRSRTLPSFTYVVAVFSPFSARPSLLAFSVALPVPRAPTPAPNPRSYLSADSSTAREPRTLWTKHQTPSPPAAQLPQHQPTPKTHSYSAYTSCRSPQAHTRPRPWPPHPTRCRHSSATFSLNQAQAHLAPHLPSWQQLRQRRVTRCASSCLLEAWRLC